MAVLRHYSHSIILAKRLHLNENSHYFDKSDSGRRFSEVKNLSCHIHWPGEMVEESRSSVQGVKEQQEVTMGEKDVINYLSLICIHFIVFVLSVTMYP